MVRAKPKPVKSSLSNSDNNTDQEKMRKKRKTVKIEVQDTRTGRSCFVTRKLYKEIKTLQSKTNLLIPKFRFSRVVKEVLMDVGINDSRIEMLAIKALHEACEMYMTQFFEDSYCCTLHAKRKTLMIKDMELTRMLRGREDVINH